MAMYVYTYVCTCVLACVCMLYAYINVCNVCPSYSNDLENRFENQTEKSFENGVDYLENGFKPNLKTNSTIVVVPVVAVSAASGRSAPNSPSALLLSLSRTKIACC